MAGARIPRRAMEIESYRKVIYRITENKMIQPGTRIY
jgi:hypothetical protein